MNEFRPNRTIVGAAPDWLTIITATELAANTISGWASKRAGISEGGEAPKRWQGFGFKGYQTNDMKVGSRGPGEVIVLLPGEKSMDVASTIPQCAYKVTRFDLQVTVCMEPPAKWLARQEFAKQEAANQLRKRPRYVKMISSPTGDTLYVGKRTSAIMLRMYDKTSAYEDGPIGKIWRFEVEYKKASAQRAYNAWQAAEDKFKWIAGLVQSEYLKRGIDPGLPISAKIDAIQVKAEAATDQGKLAWIVKCVAPVVAQLCYSGYTEEVVAALRLKHILTPSEVKNVFER